MADHHVLGISGGKDSAALAVYMRLNHPELDLKYFFTDTGKELPEVYDFLGSLEAQPAARLRLLAEGVQQLPSVASKPLVHPPVEADAVPKLDQALA